MSAPTTHLMTTEESPLLGEQLQRRVDKSRDAPPSEAVYNRFSPQQKRVILAIASLNAVVPMFISDCYIPSIPRISKDLNATPTAVSLGVTLSILATSISVVFWSPYASFYGRRVVYLCGMPFTILASFGVAASLDIYSLLAWRFIQTFGCASSYAIGAAAIGDIYKVEERGTATGTFVGAMLFGLAMAPPAGGILAEYWSWRGFQASLGLCTIIQLLLILRFFPETAHPGSLGIDKMVGSTGTKRLAWISPLSCLTFLRSPNILAITLANASAIITDYALLVPIAYTVGAKYGIRGEGMIGFLLIPSGLGHFVGAPICGYLSDLVVKRAKAERKGIWIPEDRLHAAWPGGLLFIPVSVMLAGFATTYIDGTIGLVINLLCLFTNGIGVNMVLSPIGAYTVDVMPARSAEVMAAMWALRSLILAPASALFIPAVETIGVAAMNTLVGVLAIFGYGLIWLTIRYGKEMRAFADVGFPDFDSQVPSGGDEPAGELRA